MVRVGRSKELALVSDNEMVTSRERMKAHKRKTMPETK
jgi:hypothetical protein